MDLLNSFIGWCHCPYSSGFILHHSVLTVYSILLALFPHTQLQELRAVASRASHYDRLKA